MENVEGIRKNSKNAKKGFVLSAEEVEFLKAKQKKLKGREHRDLRGRIKGVLMVGGDEPTKHNIVASRCKVHVRTLRDWLARYRESGYEGLLNKPLTGRPSRLSDEQKAELKEIVSKSPEEAGFDTGTWTSPLVKQLISTRFGEDFSLNNIQYMLHKLNLSFKLPQKKTEEPTRQSRRSGWIADSPS